MMMSEIDDLGACTKYRDDGYTIDEKGYIDRVDDTGGDDYDVLYAKDDYEATKSEVRVTGEKK
jgi:hypothetical protein